MIKKAKSSHEITFKKFLLYLRGERNYAAHTLRAYKTDLNQFYNFLKKNYPDKNINECDKLIFRRKFVVLQVFGRVSMQISLNKLRGYLVIVFTINGLKKKQTFSSRYGRAQFSDSYFPSSWTLFWLFATFQQLLHAVLIIHT